MKLMITTQILENYGAHDWDGQGECPQYWKAKGGNDYCHMLEGFCADHEFADKKLEMIVDSLRPQVESDNIGYREHVIHYEIVEDSYLTHFERDQLEYEGRIIYPTKELFI